MSPRYLSHFSDALWLHQPAREILSQETPRQDESVLALLREVGKVAAMRRIPERVLVLHRDPTVEPDLQQHREELRPVHDALSGDAVTPPSMPGNAHLLQDRLDDLGILGMYGEDTVFEVPCHRDRVNVLPHEMRRVEFQPQPLARYEVEDGLHPRRNAGEICAVWVVFPSHRHVELFANGEVFFVEDICESLGLIFDAGAG